MQSKYQGHCRCPVLFKEQWPTSQSMWSFKLASLPQTRAVCCCFKSQVWRADCVMEGPLTACAPAGGTDRVHADQIQFFLWAALPRWQLQALPLAFFCLLVVASWASQNGSLCFQGEGCSGKSLPIFLLNTAWPPALQLLAGQMQVGTVTEQNHCLGIHLLHRFGQPVPLGGQFTAGRVARLDHPQTWGDVGACTSIPQADVGTCTLKYGKQN